MAALHALLSPPPGAFTYLFVRTPWRCPWPPPPPPLKALSLFARTALIAFGEARAAGIAFGTLVPPSRRLQFAARFTGRGCLAGRSIEGGGRGLVCLPACLPPASRFLLLQGWAMQQPRAPRQFSREGLPWPEQVSQAGLNLQGTCKVAAGKKGNRPSVRRQKGSERATPGCQNSALPACCLGSAAEGSSRLGPLFHCFGGGSRSPRWHAKGGGQWGRAWQWVGSRNSWKGGKIQSFK